VRSFIADFIKSVAGDDEAAAVLGQMAWKADKRLRHLERELERRIGGIEADRAHAILADRRCLLAPGGPVESGDDVVREAEDFGCFADRRACAIGDHCGGKASALAPIVIIDILDHLFAPLVLEVDVDVRWLVAFGRDEALEQKIEIRGIDLSDPKAIADGGIGRGAAALTEDSLRTREAHDVVHGEEVGRVIERGDQRELVLERFARAPRNAVRITRFCACLSESLERLLGRCMALAQLFRIAMLEFVKAEGETVEEADGLGDGLRRFGEQPRHLAWSFEMALGIGLSEAPGGLERRFLADTGEDVGERAPLGNMHQSVVGRNQRRADRVSERNALRQPATHVLAIG